MTEIRALTVRQPWAGAIIHGGKYTENRTRDFTGGYRGPVLIHAGKMSDLDGFVDPRIRKAIEEFHLVHGEDVVMSGPRGAFIGVVDLVGVHYGLYSRHGHFQCVDHKGRSGYFSGACSPWGERDSHHLVLVRPRPLPEPIPYKGRLGLWRIDTDQVPGVERML